MANKFGAQLLTRVPLLTEVKELLKPNYLAIYVWTSLLGYANRITGKLRPGNKTLMRDLALSKYQLVTVLGTLEAAGVLKTLSKLSVGVYEREIPKRFLAYHRDREISGIDDAAAFCGEDCDEYKAFGG